MPSHSDLNFKNFQSAFGSLRHLVVNVKYEGNGRKSTLQHNYWWFFLQCLFPASRNSPSALKTLQIEINVELWYDPRDRYLWWDSFSSKSFLFALEPFVKDIPETVDVTYKLYSSSKNQDQVLSDISADLMKKELSGRRATHVARRMLPGPVAIAQDACDDGDDAKEGKYDDEDGDGAQRPDTGPNEVQGKTLSQLSVMERIFRRVRL